MQNLGHPLRGTGVWSSQAASEIHFRFNEKQEVFKGASVYVSRHSFLADSCNMLYACGCHKVPHVYRRIKVLALEIVVVHNVMHADGWGGTVH